MRVGWFLDGGTSTGWAFMTYELKPKVIARGTIQLAKFPTYGRRLHEMGKEMRQILYAHGGPKSIVHIGFEAPFSGGHAFGSRFPICAAGKIEEVADVEGVPCSEVVPSTIKKLVAGNGRAGKGGVKEGLMEMGYEFAGEHQADAIGVGLVCVNNWLRGL